MSRILVSEELAESGLSKLRAAGHEVDVQVGLTPEQLQVAIKGAHALIVRSATQVDDALLAAADDLVVVGRAGVGLDSVDVESATRRGVMVSNAPESNIVSAAEHTMAMLLASVPPDVKKISEGEAPIIAAICLRACSMAVRVILPNE
jgi:D-3-phosphoglycerate dehydrogenase